MSPAASIKRIAAVVTGVIGSSWTAFHLARGFDVAAIDPALGVAMTRRAGTRRRSAARQGGGAWLSIGDARTRMDGER